MELESMTALELAAKIRQREVSVLDGVKEVFDQIESKEDKVFNSLVIVFHVCNQLQTFLLQIPRSE